MKNLNANARFMNVNAAKKSVGIAYDYESVIDLYKQALDVYNTVVSICSKYEDIDVSPSYESTKLGAFTIYLQVYDTAEVPKLKKELKKLSKFIKVKDFNKEDIEISYIGSMPKFK